MEAAGIEGTAHSSKIVAVEALRQTGQELSALCLHGDDTSCRGEASSDTVLRRINELWPSLPSSIKRALFAMCVDAVLLGD